MRRALATTASARASTTLTSTRPRPRPAYSLTATPAARPFSSSTSNPFFFRRPEIAPSQIVQDLTRAASDGRPDLVAKLYPSLVDAYKSSSSSLTSSSSSAGPILTQRKLQGYMRSIAQSNRINLLLRMFQDLSTVFNFTPSPLDHHLLVMGLVNSGKMIKATRWLDSIEQTHGLKPHVSDFNLILQGWRRKKDLYEMRSLVQNVMRDKHGIEPNVVTYNTFISALFEQGGKLDEVRKLVREMEENRIEPDLYTETALLTGYLDAGELGSAREVQKRLAPVVTKAANSGGLLDSTKYDTAMVNALLKYEARVEGFESAVDLAEKYKRGGVPLDNWTLNSLLVEGSQDLRKAEEGVRLIEQLEDLVELQADRRAWSVVINEMARSRQGGGIDEALNLYYLARDRSIDPDTTMIHPLVEALLTPSPTPESFAIAKALYEDLSTSNALSSRDFSLDQQPIYALLLRACADPSTLDISYSRTLISDMKARGIKLDSTAAMSHIESLMRASSSYEEAFESYDELRALDPSVLSSTTAYNSVLSTFLSLSFPSSSSSPPPTAPPPLVMEFLSDMRKSSHPANSITYSILLTYYSRTSSASPSLIEHLHSLIKLDINFDPDTALFNSLMSAYSRVGAFNQTFRIWETMLINTKSGSSIGATGGGIGPDQRSVSILLDACGWNRSKDAKTRGRRVWNDLGTKRIRIVRNKKNWDTWIECLCRWGEIDEATRVATEEMGVEGNSRADKDTFEVLIKFSRTFGREKWEEVRGKVFGLRPDLREELKDVGGEPGLRELEEEASRQEQEEK
ncbi:hypothetical protein JCM16303_005628 [Sporobolomyces ruberrimus]